MVEQLPEDQKRLSGARKNLQTILNSIQDCNNELLELETAKEQAQKEFQQLSIVYKEKEQQLTTITSEIRRRAGELHRLDTKGRAEIDRSHKEHKKSLLGQIKEYQNELNKLIDQVNSQRDELSDIQKQFNEVCTQRQNLLEANRRLVIENDDLVKSNADMTASNRATSEDIIILKGRRSDLLSDINNITTQHDQLKIDLETALAGFDDKVKTKRVLLNAELFDKKEELRSCQEEIKQLRLEDIDRIKTIENDERAIAIKRKALKKEQEEFDIKRRQFFARNGTI